MARAEKQLFEGPAGRIIRAFSLGVVSAASVNMALMLVLDATNLVAYPYDMTGFLIGVAIMIPVGFAAALSRMGGIVAAMTAMLFGVAYGAIAWNADKFIEVLPLTTCAVVLPAACALVAGWSSKSLDPAPLPSGDQDPIGGPTRSLL